MRERKSNITNVIVETSYVSDKSRFYNLFLMTGKLLFSHLQLYHKL